MNQFVELFVPVFHKETMTRTLQNCYQRLGIYIYIYISKTQLQSFWESRLYLLKATLSCTVRLFTPCKTTQLITYKNNEPKYQN
jgi:hypothetical protein